jgi:O-methyltransferase involved in polyketide biosynthesis
METVQQQKGSFLFMAEGVFMYLGGNDVRSLVLKLQDKFRGSELVCEVFNSVWLKFPLNIFMDYKLWKRMHLGKNAAFRSGIRESREMEQWHPGIIFLDDWSYFDADEPKLGWLRVFRHVGFMRKTQWTVHYRLD